MSEAKIDIKIGQIQFSGEGDQDWVAKQLDKILAQAEKLVQLALPEKENEGDGEPHKPMKSDALIAKKTLPAFLNEKGASTNQVKKFLSTAIWLEAKGQNRLQTRDITGALRSAKQSRLVNPSDSLNKNVSKGFCEKEGTQFYVTEEGKKSL
jgi:hypothetical protein